MSRWGRRASLALTAFAALCAASAANLWALRAPFRVDFTERGVFSVGPETARVLAGLDRPVRVTFFYDLRNQVHVDALALLERYAEASPFVTVRGLDPDLHPAQARSMGVRFAGESVFEGGGAPLLVRGGTEQDFTNGLLRATSGAQRELCFSEGHGEADPESLSSHDHFETQEDPGHHHSAPAFHGGGEPFRIAERHGLGAAREALETLGYRVTRRVIAGSTASLSGCAVLVVASPTARFSAREVDEIRGFLDAGGAALLMLEPGVEPGLDPLLDDFGIRRVPGAVRDPARHYWTDPGTPAVSRYPNHRITRGLALSFFPGAGSFEPRGGGVPDDVVVTPLLETSERAYRVDAPDLPGRRALMVYAVRTRSRGEAEERTARLVAIGDGDFATNSFFPVLGNRDLLLNTLHTLAEVERLIGIAPRTYARPRVTLTGAQLRTSFVLSTLLMPGAACLAGVWMWRQRRA